MLYNFTSKENYKCLLGKISRHDELPLNICAFKVVKYKTLYYLSLSERKIAALTY